MSEAVQKPLFDLTLTDEQQLMRETVRKFVQKEMTTKEMRNADEAAQAPNGFYEKAQELGFSLVSVPEAHGGLGADRSPLSNVLIAEDLAYGDMALAMGAMSSLSFVNALLDYGSDGQQAKYLPPFVEEAFRPAGVALMEPGLRRDVAKLSTAAVREGDQFVLRGEKVMVPFGSSAPQLLVIARVEGAGTCAFLVDRDTPGVSAERESYMGLRPLELARVKFDDVRLPVDRLLGEGQKSFDFQRFLNLSRIGLAALTVGTCKAVLDYVKEYCNDRVAFGEPITNRQSVAFMIADIAIELDGLRLMTYRAASRAEQGMPFSREAFLSKLQAADKGMKIGTDGVQLLGGHGFIRDHMVELYYRNLRAIALLDGVLSV